MSTVPASASGQTSFLARIPGGIWLLLPAVLFLGIFFLWPLLRLLSASLPGGDFQYYEQIFDSPVFLRVIAATFKMALIVMLVTVLIAYPYAYAMANAGRRTLLLLTIALLIPFWVSLLLRSFSWVVLLQNSGLVNDLLLGLGITEKPLRLIRTPTGVAIGMVHVLLPYAVLPLYTIMKKIDIRLMEASAICGASYLRSFLRVYLPLSLPGVAAAAILTFTLSLGFYITPALLGGARDMMIPQMIAGQFLEQLNFGLGAALAVVLLAITAIAFGLFGAARLYISRRASAQEKA
ncbi:ABC transporter permease [Pseudogemmobacter faecipullorum]|uniref:ABC transporter permease n=1 Tax=Pseudogemmobacter faecipullorum TaxID=2755041 RepID=A0ABS8CMV7_9RHOB|nr:ABC transporter permease [Pseudogemmobacter faecipullorum]MCB5410721.1 ABC transporter permease [Pseudogemmobacter faecipullorum]